MPLDNIPGMVSFYDEKQRRKPGSSPFNPTGAPGGASGGFGRPPAPVPGPGGPSTPPKPMGGYIERQAGQMQQTASTPSTPPPLYRPSADSAAPNFGGAPQQPPRDTPAPQVLEYQPPQPSAPVTVPTAPQTSIRDLPQAGPAPQAGAPGSTLQDPGQITDAGKAYAERVTQNLGGDNPLVTNAQNTEDTAAARRAYLSRMGATEALAQTPFAPGSAQYQRVMTESRAGVDAANQAGQAGVNAVARQAGLDSMGQARDLEDQQFGRAIGERTNQQLNARDLASQIQDPKARYAFQAAVAAGVDPQLAFQEIIGDTGTISEQYRGQSPVQAIRQDAVDWVKATTALAEGSPEFNEAVTTRMQAIDETQRAPLSEADDDRNIAGIKKKVRSGDKLTEDETETLISTGAVPQMSPETLPFGRVKDWVRENPDGLVNMDGVMVKVLPEEGEFIDHFYTKGISRQGRWYDWVAVEVDGKKYKVDNRGNWYKGDEPFKPKGQSFQNWSISKKQKIESPLDSAEKEAA